MNKYIDRLRYFLGISDVSDYVLGLDLNVHRPGLDLKLAKQQEIRFIICRTTASGAYQDPEYLGYKDQANLLGMPFTGYHYWRAGIDVITQAKNYCDTAIHEDHELLDALDVETIYNTGVLSTAKAVESIDNTATEMEQRIGREVMIYTNWNSWNVLTGGSVLIQKRPLWVASWGTNNPTLPENATDWIIWQFTNQYPITGAPQTYDGNRFHGNDAEFEAYLAELAGDPGPGDHYHPDYEERLNSLEKGHNRQHKRIQVLEDADYQDQIDNLMRDITEHDIRIAALEDKMQAISEAAKGSPTE